MEANHTSAKKHRHASAKKLDSMTGRKHNNKHAKERSLKSARKHDVTVPAGHNGTAASIAIRTAEQKPPLPAHESREFWRPSNLLYPLPAVLVTCADEEGHTNVMTAAWTGTVCSDPVMVYVSIRPSRYSHDMIERTGEFVINLTTRGLVRQTDYAGVRSGRKEDKIEALHLHPYVCQHVAAPGILESPVSLECKVTQILRLGSHDMFLANVLSTDIDPYYLDSRGRFDLDRADLIAYAHGEYRDLGEVLGTFGFSVKKQADTNPPAGNNTPDNSGKKAEQSKP